MAKGKWFQFIFGTFLITQTHANSIVNSRRVSSDVFSTIFFNEIQHNPDLLNTSIPNTGQFDSRKCILALQGIAGQATSISALSFVDSWGKLPSGLLYGHWIDMGNFDQCIRISTVLSQTTGLVKGQYCFVSVPLVQNRSIDISGVIGFEPANNDSAFFLDMLKINLAICTPDSCDPEFVQGIFQSAADEYFNGSVTGIKVNRCHTDKKPDLDATAIVGIVIFSIFGALMVLSTAYDVCTEYQNKTPVPMLLAFSVITNGRQLFAINVIKSTNTITCLAGIRVLSMVWIIFCHNYLMLRMLATLNFIDWIPWFTSTSAMPVLFATVSVDTFLFISGMLLAWLHFAELDRRGKLNIPKMYVHRYLRLTPAVAALILFYVSIYDHIGTGPFKHTRTEPETCKSYWWSTLLYVQNYVYKDTFCVSQSWYLAVDTQLYVLSPLILIPFWKWGRKFVPVMVILSILSYGFIIGTYYARDYRHFFDFARQSHIRSLYVPVHSRFSVWLIGIGVGYFMHKNRNKVVRPSTLVQLFGWVVSFTTFAAVIFGPYFTLNSDRKITTLEIAAYEAFKRSAWAIAVAWIVFACHFGFGGIINTFLSHLWWQPLERLTYSMYLVHVAVVTLNFEVTRNDVYFSNYTMISIFWSTFGVSLMAAIVWSLSFESPIIAIEKALRGPPKRKDTTVKGTSDNVNRTDVTESSQKSA